MNFWDRLDKSNLSGLKMRVLIYIYRNRKGHRNGELARHFGISKSNMCKTIAELEKENWITRENNVILVTDEKKTVINFENHPVIKKENPDTPEVIKKENPAFFNILYLYMLTCSIHTTPTTTHVCAKESEIQKGGVVSGCSDKNIRHNSKPLSFWDKHHESILREYMSINRKEIKLPAIFYRTRRAQMMEEITIRQITEDFVIEHRARKSGYRNQNREVIHQVWQPTQEEITAESRYESLDSKTKAELENQAEKILNGKTGKAYRKGHAFSRNLLKAEVMMLLQKKEISEGTENVRN